MVLTTRASAITPAVPQTQGINHAKRFLLNLSFSDLDDAEYWVVLGSATSVPATYGDFTSGHTFRLTDSLRLSLSADPISGEFSGAATWDRDGADWSAGDTLYVAFAETHGIIDNSTALLGVKGPFTVA